MLPMKTIASTDAALHIYVTNRYGKVIDRKVSLEGLNFQVKKNQCLKLDLNSLTWDEDGQLVSTFKPLVTWGETISINVNVKDLSNFEPGAELNSDASSYYYYNQLETENQKKLYEQICRGVIAFDDGGSSLPNVFIQTSANFTRDEFTSVSNAVSYDMPSFFHFKYASAYGSGWARLSLSSPYDQFVYKYKLAIEGANEILSRMPQGMSEFERAKWLWDEFLRSVSYGQLQGSEGNIYGAFCIHKVVCEGYARAYQYLCQRAGIQALYVEGTASSGNSWVSHAWNIVRVDGKYYYSDPTFDDGMLSGSTTVRYDNFLKGKEAFEKTHTLKTGMSYPEINESNYPLNL